MPPTDPTTEAPSLSRPCSCGAETTIRFTSERFERLEAPAEHPEWALVPCPKCRMPVPFRLPTNLTQRPQPREGGGFMSAAMEAGQMTWDAPKVGPYVAPGRDQGLTPQKLAELRTALPNFRVTRPSPAHAAAPRHQGSAPSPEPAG
jgi:hypothetical protein